MHSVPCPNPTFGSRASWGTPTLDDRKGKATQRYRSTIFVFRAVKMIFILAVLLLWALSFQVYGVSDPAIHVLLALGTLALIVQVRRNTAAD